MRKQKVKYWLLAYSYKLIIKSKIRYVPQLFAQQASAIFYIIMDMSSRVMMYMCSCVLAYKQK